MELNKSSATQFALMLKSGMPSTDAIQYFFDDEQDPERLRFEHDRWIRSGLVRDAVDAVQGKKWSAMTLQEQIQFAIDKHYAELAYFLYSHNYSTLSGAERQKADTCRQALEAKLAGMAGKMTPLTAWFDDVRSGRIKLPALPS